MGKQTPISIWDFQFFGHKGHVQTIAQGTPEPISDKSLVVLAYMVLEPSPHTVHNIALDLYCSVEDEIEYETLAYNSSQEYRKRRFGFSKWREDTYFGIDSKMPVEWDTIRRNLAEIRKVPNEAGVVLINSILKVSGRKMDAVYTLQVGTYTSDVDRFERLYDFAMDSRNAPRERMKAAVTGIETYGMGFLVGVTVYKSAAEWLVDVRENLSKKYAELVSYRDNITHDIFAESPAATHTKPTPAVEVPTPPQPISKEAKLLEERHKYRQWMQDRFNAYPVTNFLKDLGMSVDKAEEAEVVQRRVESKAASEMEVSPLFEERHQNTSLEIVNVDTALRRNRHLLIVGEAGDGKSTLMHKLCRKYAQDQQASCPLLLRSWEYKDLVDVESYITSGRYLQSSGVSAEFAAVHWRLICEGKAPLLLDGLDESNRRAEINDALHSFTSGAGRNAVIIVTCRKALAVNLLPAFERVEFSPLKREQIRLYVHNRLSHADAIAFMKALDTDRRAMALVGSGLLLAIATYLYEESRIPLPSSRAELYAKASETLLKNPLKDNRPGRPETEKVYLPAMKSEVLEDLAFHWLFCWRDLDGCSEEQVIASLGRVVNPSTRWKDKDGYQEEILWDLCANSSLLREEKVKGNTRFRFFHRSFAEYFAARYLVQRWDVEGWRDWLPTREGWQEWGYSDLPWNNVVEDGQKPPLQSFGCSVCQNRFLAFAKMLLLPEYRETFQLMVGLLNDAKREAIFLNGIARELPPIPGYESESYHKGTYFRVRFNAEDRVTGEMWAYGTRQKRNIWPYLEHKVLLSDVQIWLEWAIDAVNRCQSDHGAVVMRVLSGLHIVSERGPSNDVLILLDKFRHSAQIAACVEFYRQQLTNKSHAIHVRRRAAEILGYIRTNEARSALSVVFNDKTDHDKVREKAIAALEHIGNTDDLPALFTMFNDKTDNYYVRKRAVEVLGSVGGKDTLPVLSAVLNDKTDTHDIHVRMWVASALGGIGSTEVLPVLSATLNDKTDDSYVRMWVAEALGSISSVDALPFLSTVLKDKTDDNYVRGSVALALGRIGSTDVLPVLSMVLSDKTDNDDVRGCAAAALGNISSADALPVLSTVLKDKINNYYVRRRAASALGSIGDTAALPVLSMVLSDKTDDDDVRESAASALGRISSADALPVLSTVLKDKTDNNYVRKRTASALDEIGGTAALPVLSVALNDKTDDDDVRGCAAAALGRISSADALPVLSTVLKDKTDNNYVRKRTASALGEIGSAARSALEHDERQLFFPVGDN